MRCCGKRAIVAAFGQALLKHGRWTNSFADNAAKIVPAIEILSKCSSQPSKSTAAVARRARGRTGCWAAATVGGSEDAFATGGAERVAELLAGESAGEGAVFYNRVGAINRDLSVLMANVLAEERVRERLAGKKRKKRQIPPTSRPSPADSTLRSRASLADYVTQGGAARSSTSWGVRAFVKGALRRLSRGYWGGGVERVSNNADQQEEPREDEDGILILDAFAASGVRALRYLTEVPGVQRVVANDYDEAAINTIRQAAVQCGVGSKLDVHRGDAVDTLYSARAGGLGTYDLIDID
ncbi:unnamed protein product, partial [Ectocarpus sp. 12 AP-2014]